MCEYLIYESPGTLRACSLRMKYPSIKRNYTCKKRCCPFMNKNRYNKLCKLMKDREKFSEIVN